MIVEVFISYFGKPFNNLRSKKTFNNYSWLKSKCFLSSEKFGMNHVLKIQW